MSLIRNVSICLLVLFVCSAVSQAEPGDLLFTFDNPTPAGHEWFGKPVCSVGDRVVVGAHGNDIGATSYAGGAYVFDSTTGQLVHSLLNPTPAHNDMMGTSIAAFGDDILVGCYQDHGYDGAVYILDGGTGALLR